MSDRDIIMREREPEPQIKEPYWVVQFTDGSCFTVPESVAGREVVFEGEKQHAASGLTGAFGYAFHVPTGEFIHGPLSSGEVGFLPLAC